ncbi:hypothetical protein [Leptolyngbya iicbica]|uniref:Uncharacterized protein n=2 Tax=Cyanophyceae TaxID=3028117 RepID=A0A4Q7E5S5_9CYAN|nr:hypothetical protein [Leptolyngbya sp. LK]RZM77797.1 hypothetical protein DYY88_14575 [Leptolyngbya sp. LK]
MKGRKNRSLPVGVQAVLTVMHWLWRAFQILDAVVVRLLRGVIRTVYLPLAIAVCSVGAYLFADRLAPYLVDLTIGSFLEGVSLSVWERVCRWSLAITFAGVGWIGYKRHQELSKLRSQHEFTFGRYRELFATPGSRITDFLWAYLVATLQVNVPVGLMIFIIFVAPFLITENWLFRFFLVFFLMSGMGTFLNAGAAVLMETFRPRRLEAEVQGAGQIKDELEKQYQQYLAEKETRERANDSELRNNDW